MSVLNPYQPVFPVAVAVMCVICRLYVYQYIACQNISVYNITCISIRVALYWILVAVFKLYVKVHLFSDHTCTYKVILFCQWCVSASVHKCHTAY